MALAAVFPMMGLLLCLRNWAVPLGLLHEGGHPWPQAVAALPLPWMGGLLFLFGLLAWVGAAVWAHRATRRVLAEEQGSGTSQQSLSRGKRSALITLLMLLWLVVLFVLATPLLTLGLGFVAEGRSIFLKDGVTPSLWPWPALGVSTALALLLVQIFALYTRAVFHSRTLSPIHE